MLKGKNGRSGFGGSARRVVASVALFLFSLHALLPVGFMVDTDSLRDGRYEVVICTGVGFQTIVVDKAGNRIDPTAPAEDGSDMGFKCPFAAVNGYVLAAAGMQATLPQGNNVTGRLLPAVHDLRADRVAGFPLGSRAPPVHLG
ncbi:MAG: hypothetical protein RIB80_17305 [Rhodospirillales bacterium]